MTNQNNDNIVSDAETTQSDELKSFYYFPSSIYVVDKPEFLQDAKKACEQAINKRKKEQELDEIYPAYMTENLFEYEGMDKFSNYIAQTAWGILKQQGYDVSNLSTHFSEFWCQEHYKHSTMEQHVHGYGSQIVGFYFIDTPENCSKVLFHDPRSAKVQIDLPEIDITQATPASKIINFEPKPGMLMFSNSWLPHSFTRHASLEPMRFIHFNLYVQQNQPVSFSEVSAEVI